MFYKIVILLMRFVVWVLFSAKFEGLENIPTDQGFVLAGNHRSYFDPIFAAIHFPVEINAMGKAELFDNKILGFIISHLNTFPVQRGKGDSSTLDKAVGILKAGEPLLIFIEGTRSKTGIPGRPRSGAAALATQAGVGVLPFSIDYGVKLKFRGEIAVRFHPLITQQELGVDIEQPRTIRTASKKIMEEIVSGLTHLPEIKEAVQEN